MKLSGKQKKQIVRLVRAKSFQEVARELRLEPVVVKDYLISKWGEKKFQDRCPEEKKQIREMSFIGWLGNNKLWLILLTILVGLTYINGLNNDFVSDDINGIVNNLEIINFSWVFKNPLIIVGRLQYFVISNLFGLTPWAFRMVNITAHIVMTLGMFCLVEILASRRAGIMAGILVAVHPLLTESVTWISGGGYAMYSACLIWALIFYIWADKKKHWLWWSIIMFVIALQYSEKAVVFPAILIVYRLLWRRKKRQWLGLIPFICLSGFWIGMNLLNLGGRLEYLAIEHVGAEGGYNPLIQIPIALSSYLELIFWPDKLTLYHSEMVFSGVSFALRAGLALGLLGLAGVSFFQGIKGKEWGKQVAFWLVWFLIALSPTLTPFGVSWIVAERYVYLAAAGILALMAIVIEKLMSKKNWLEGMVIGFGLLVMILTTRTIVRNHDWKNHDNLWLSAERTSPNSPQNHNNLGDLYSRRGEFGKAEKHFKRAIELRPNYADAWHNLATNYIQIGKLEEAIEGYKKALSYKPGLWQSHQQLAAIYYYQERFGEARKEIEESIKINPNNESLRIILEELEKGP